MNIARMILMGTAAASLVMTGAVAQAKRKAGCRAQTGAVRHAGSRRHLRQAARTRWRMGPRRSWKLAPPLHGCRGRARRQWR